MQSLLLRVNSKYRTLSDTPWSFSYNLVNSEAVSSVKAISLLSFSMCRLFTNIDEYNNKLATAIDGNIVNVYVVKPGQYTAESLVVAMQTAFGTQILVSFKNDRFIFASTIAVNLTLVAAESTIGPYIGFTTDVKLLPTLEAPLPHQPQLQGPCEIFVQSSLIAQNSCLDNVITTGGYIPLVSIVSCADVAYGYCINHKAREEAQMRLTNSGMPLQLRFLRIDLCDRFGNPLTSIPANCYADLLFKVEFE
jgi:hypothetical protein